MEHKVDTNSVKEHLLLATEALEQAIGNLQSISHDFLLRTGLGGDLASQRFDGRKRADMRVIEHRRGAVFTFPIVGDDRRKLPRLKEVLALENGRQRLVRKKAWTNFRSFSRMRPCAAANCVLLSVLFPQFLA